MNLLEFLASEESKEILKDLTIAERVKYATAFQWAGEKPTPEEAKNKAKQKCSEEAISRRHEDGNNSFESELAAISAIKDIAYLKEDEEIRLDDEVFTSQSLSDDLKETIKTVFQERGTEDAIIDALCSIHNNWMRNHGDNFQKVGRDKDYQFVDLRLMPFGDDGATADLIFLRPILEECGIEINMERLEQRFNEMQEEFIRENGIQSQEDLSEYLSRGSENNEVLDGLVSGTGKTIDEILSNKPEVVNHMAEQVMSKLPEHAKVNVDELTPQVMEEYSESINEAEETIRDDMEKGKNESVIDQQNLENR